MTHLRSEMGLYDFQQKDKDGIMAAWEHGHKNILYVLPCGGGKTVVFSSILAESNGMSVVIAHRREILGQIALALAKNKVPHALIAPDKTVSFCRKQQRDSLGRSYVTPNARVFVASVDTLQARRASLTKWGLQIQNWVQDEAHHVLKDNKWGKVLSLFPNSRGLGVTATPLRGDRRSLHTSKGGVFQTLVQGPSPRDLIARGYLSDYRIFSPMSDIDISKVPMTPSGDFSGPKLAIAAKNSHIVGDVVDQYLKLTPGLVGATFAVNVDSAEGIANHFRAKGVPAVSLNAKSLDSERFDAVRAAKNGELKQLVNVDLFGEGFDLPQLGVVSFARHTASYGLYVQQFGRVWRAFPGKTHGVIIDHVGNVLRHGLPDRLIDWSLELGGPPREILTGPPLRSCSHPLCLKVWESYSRTCPHCGFTPEIAERSTPEQVEGDLFELDAATLAIMRGGILKANATVSETTSSLEYGGAPAAAVAGLAATHRKKQVAQRELRDTMALWGGYARGIGLNDSERQIKFYREFGVDVLSAQALSATPAIQLQELISISLNQF